MHKRTEEAPHQLAPVKPVAAEASDAIDLWEYVRILRRRWLVVLLMIVIAVGATAFVTLRMTKIYRAIATIQIDTQAPQVLGQQVENVVEMGSGSFWSNIEYFETQYRIIESRAIAAKTVTILNLLEHPGDIFGPPDPVGAKNKPKRTLEEAALAIRGMISVEPIKESRLTRINVDHANPFAAQLIANAVAEAYVAHNQERMHKSTIDAGDWLNKALITATDELKKAEEKLRQYENENELLAISITDRKQLLSAQMIEEAGKLAEARSRRIEVQSRKSAIAGAINKNEPMSIPLESLNTSPLIQTLKEQHALLNLEYGELSTRYGENFPKMIELKSKILRIQNDISREVTNIIHSVDAELAAAISTENGIRQSLNVLENDAKNLADKAGPYQFFAREAANKNKIYELLMGRADETDLSVSLSVNNVSILDRALLPETPIKPRLMVNLALSLLVGLLLGIGLALVIEYSDRSLKTQDEVEALGIPFLGIVPCIDSASYVGTGYSKPGHKKKSRPSRKPAEPGEIDYDTYVSKFPKSQVAESLRSIRTNLLFMTAGKSMHRILVTSPSPQEGKTTVAANLAIIMAQSNTKVLLVDTDMRRPRVHRAFNIQRPKLGLSTMVLGQSTAAESIIHTDIPNLDILVCGPTPPNPSELIHTDIFVKTINDVAAMYDKVIFDSPPIGVVTDAAILSKLIDGTILIFKSMKTTRDSAKHTVSILKDINANIYGAILNNLDLKNRKYGQYYYYYYRRYGAYYSETELPDDNANKPSSNNSAAS